jgi:uncharacterized protein YdbL (DUF1318 family)
MRQMSLLIVLLMVFGCAKVSVETKEPIKVDINMRVDVYQHIVKEADSINDQIYGDDDQSFNIHFFLQEACAADSSAQVQEAITRRKARAKKIKEFFKSGYIGENRNAYLEARGDVPADVSAEVQKAVGEENRDRKIIYEAQAAENDVSVSEVQKIFFKDDYERAPSGYWFEIKRGGSYTWAQK